MRTSARPWLVDAAGDEQKLAIDEMDSPLWQPAFVYCSNILTAVTFLKANKSELIRTTAVYRFAWLRRDGWQPGRWDGGGGVAKLISGM